MCQDQTVLLFGKVVSSGVLLFKDVIAGWIKFCPGQAQLEVVVKKSRAS